ncbi:MULTISPECIES: hypothetical protein [unclassified Bradyrhizobium]|uniref:hypothetical protein n=1 Tax=unclassified Bradyrhizobium TaxID=2631580 RepID=UPI001FF72450|nr:MULTISPECIES: hypothetical protein [unclassified Bradyrhizobium]MCK1611031.1 hypothetical protein [Bradyrhizobium sp. 163]MCK1762785.1 hypothetical protein [Bradyrhizobium sp. 136]
MTELPKTLATDAGRAQADAYANAMLCVQQCNPTADTDPYVDSGKVDWFNRSESYDDIDARLDQQALEVSDTRQAANDERKRAQELLAAGNSIEADCALASARQLDAQANSNVRRVLQNRRLFSERFTRMAEEGRWAEVASDLVAAIKSPEADHALRVACTQCLREIAPSFLGDTAIRFDARWLADRAGIPLRTAQELMSDANRIEAGIAALFIDTELGSRKALQEFASEAPSTQRARASTVQAHLTQHLLACGMATEKRKRTGSVSVTELRALAYIGRNDETGWAHLLALSPAHRTEWLGQMIEARERQTAIEERRSERMNRALRQIKSDLKNKRGSRQRASENSAASGKDAA